MAFHNKLLAKNCFSTCQSPNGLCTYASWRAPLWESEGSVTPFLEAVCRCAEGRTVRRGTSGCHLDYESISPAFPHALLGQAANPRRLVVHHDDSVFRSCAYPSPTLL